MGDAANCINTQPEILEMITHDLRVSTSPTGGRSAVSCENSGPWRRQLPEDMETTVALVLLPHSSPCAA